MKISIIVPVHDMARKNYFLKRCLGSVYEQTFEDFELIMPENGQGMAKNINEGIRMAKGEVVKLLFLDDYFAHPRALQKIADNFTRGWLVTGCEHDDDQIRGNPHLPTYNDQIHTGLNTIGSPSVLAFENDKPELFDEKLSWMLDCDVYKRLFTRYGEPAILNDINVVIGVGEHQTTHLMPLKAKQKEQEEVTRRYS